jgi:predicted Zn-dependent protease
MKRHAAAALCAVTSLGLALGAFSGCATNPVTGKQELALISEPQEVAIGQDAAQDVARSIGLVDDTALQNYVSNIGQRLAANSERPELPWTFKVVDDPTPNAFALPGGYIFVTRGLLSLMTSEAELASVLGHEIGHVTARHSVSQMSRAQLAQLGLGLGMILVPELQNFGGLASSGLQLLFLKYGRDAERQADELGFDYALQQNYDVQEMADVFVALQKSGELAGRSALPGWLATHPAESDRITAVQARVASMAAQQQSPKIAEAAYLDSIDGMVFGQNPRAGFFRGGTFYHPDLKFKFTLPDEWRNQNMTSAVVGISPQQNAAAELTLAGDASPADAARQFSTQQNVRVGNSSSQRIAGGTAVVTPFLAQAEQTVVQGYAAFIGQGGRTYRLVTYAPQQAFDQYDQTFRGLVASFGPVTDREILDIQPQRIDIVKVDRDITVSDFARRQNSPVPAAELALINHVDGPSATLRAGSLVKRITGPVLETGSRTASVEP